MIKKGIRMKRDMDLIRKMLLAMEADASGFVSQTIEIPDYTQEEINYHAILLGEAGLAVVSETKTRDGSIAIVDRLTWAGHEFLDTSRENKTWNQAKDVIAKVGGASIQIWTTVLTELVKKNLGF